jgi:hypothetical protein
MVADPKLVLPRYNDLHMRLERLSLLYVAFACAAGIAHTEDTPKDVLQLARARAHMSSLLTRLPNYTCLQNIERTRRGPSGRTQLVDVVRIEVALVNGNELFAWPGSKKFEETKLIDMVKGGAIGNGSFALHAKSVFQSNSPRFTFIGERIREDGRKTMRWDYVVPQFMSGYLLRSGGQEAIVGFHGSVWVDRTTLDAVRLEVHADDIPPRLKIAAASDTMEYQRVSLGEEDFLLPAKSELTVVGMDGHESINRTSFTGCRQYTGESVISFDDPAPDARAKSDASARVLHLPAGMDLRVALDTPVEENKSAVGDPVTAILKKEVKLGSGLVAPKGAFLHGRVTHLRRQDGQTAGWAVGFEFFELEWENTRASLKAQLVATPSLESRTVGDFRIRTVITQAARESGTFFVPGQRLSVRRGFPMHWRTQPPGAEDKE